MSALGFVSAGAAMNAMASSRPGVGGYVYTYAQCGIWHWCADGSAGAKVVEACIDDPKLRFHRINPDADAEPVTVRKAS